ncbi:HNH endonuclease family protein [Arthrobacter globiformis]|uniref:HNH endonuclease family protein n=1 Tax=Arthrobacter globiformis TaxID=1665 RepID=UPI000B41C6A7|nr:HNH endonuclease family protein [Arthrobacter globiformis]
MHHAPPRGRNWFTAGVLAAVILATTACGGVISATRQPTSDAVPGGSAGSTAGYAKAADLLAALPVKGRAPKTGYDREEFGPAWSDTDHNGCDTRNDILARDLKRTTFKPGTKDCIVLTGSLADPYTATTIAFTRGNKTSSAVQIDHVVALSDAWQKGAQGLSKAQRTAFANDPLNLLAVSGPANQQKSDGDAATWLPGSRAYRCPYVARQISVKAKYKLWVTQAERTAMATVLAQCGGTVAGSK